LRYLHFGGISQFNISEKFIYVTQTSGQSSRRQGCQMAYFQTKNPSLVKFLWALQWERLVFSMALWNLLHTGIWYILWPFDNLMAVGYM
jgi:hypothetical protein